MNHFRLPASVPTFALNDVKCLLIDARSSSIRSRKRDRRSGPSSITPSTTWATAFSHGVRGSSLFPDASSRSETLSLRRPPQVARSVVTWVEVKMPRRIRSNSVAVNSNEPASPPCRSSVGTSAGSVSVGGSCSYSRS